MLFSPKICHIPFSQIFVAESLTSVAEVLMVFSQLFMITALFNFTGTIAAAPVIIKACLSTNGYLPFPGVKALPQA